VHGAQGNFGGHVKRRKNGGLVCVKRGKDRPQPTLERGKTRIGEKKHFSRGRKTGQREEKQEAVAALAGERMYPKEGAGEIFRKGGNL